MDVEIVKQNGQSFRLSDYGIVQDFVVHSIDRSVVRDPIEGRAGSADYGVEIGDRTIEVPMIFKAADLHDYAHLRDELYGLLDDSEPFYIREMRRPKALQYDFVDFGQKPRWEPQTDNEYVNGKQYKVRLNSTLTPEQRSLSGEVNIEFVTSGNPYAETIYTTLELHDSGYSALVEKYGLVDNIDDEKVKYRFTPNKTDTKLYTVPFQHGFIGADGKVIQEGTGSYTLNVGYFDLVEGMTYEFRDLGENEKVLYWWLYFYDENEEFVERIPLNQFGNGKEYTFTANSPKMKIMLNPKYPIESYKVGLDEVGVDVLPTLIHNSNTHSFVVHNAGNVTVQPESMMLNIHARFVRSDNNFTIRNITTGEEVILKRESKGSHFRIQGMVISLGSIINIFRDTNRRFISLAPGDNQLEILNGSFEEIRFDFKFLYK